MESKCLDSGLILPNYYNDFIENDETGLNVE